MPKIQFKEDTLNGRAAIVAYADREYLTLRILRGNKNIRTFRCKLLISRQLTKEHLMFMLPQSINLCGQDLVSIGLQKSAKNIWSGNKKDVKLEK